MNLPWNEQLSAVRRRLGMDQAAMGNLLGVGREWISKLEKNKEAPSAAIRAKLQALAAESGLHFSDPDATNAAPAVGPDISPVIRSGPSTRSDCEFYFNALLEAAKASRNPNAFPVIHDRLQKFFPLSEWSSPATSAAAPPGSIVITPEDIAKMKQVVNQEHARILKQAESAAEYRPQK